MREQNAHRLVLAASSQGEELRRRIYEAYHEANPELERIGDAFVNAIDAYGNPLNRKERRKRMSSKAGRRRT